MIGSTRPKMPRAYRHMKLRAAKGRLSLPETSMQFLGKLDQHKDRMQQQDQEEEAGVSVTIIDSPSESSRTPSRAGSEEPRENTAHGSGSHSKQGSPSKDCHAEGKSLLEEFRTSLCQSHLNFRHLRRNTNSVGCQTDATLEFPSKDSPSTCTKSTATDQSATSSSATDGVLRLMIQNFPNMSDTVRGPSKRINGVLWKIMVMPRQHVVQKKGTQKCLGFFLQCCPDAYSDTWSCQAAAELRLISQKQGVPHFTRKTNHVYTAKENDWGYSCFMTWADILDENQGYIKDERVVLEVSVKADAPKNVLSHDEFCRSLQSWYDLAEMQYKRGLIDLAIEANAQAIKFCKDRDKAYKGRLEKQRKFFVDKKLVESIQRIEKKDGTPKADEENQSSQNALKLALSQNTHKNGNGKSKGSKKDRKYRPATPPGLPPNVTGGKKTDNKKQPLDASAVKNGRFSKNTMCSFSLCQPPFHRRSVEGNVPAHAVVDTTDPFVVKYMADQFGIIGDGDELKENSGTHYSILDVEIQRMFVEKSESDAQEFVEKVEDQEFVEKVEDQEFVEKVEDQEFVEKVEEQEFVEKVDEQEFVEKVEEQEFVEKVEEQEFVEKVDEQEFVEKVEEQEFVEKVEEQETEGEANDDLTDLPEMKIESLFKPKEKIEKRLSIIDLEAKKIDARIRLFMHMEEHYENGWFPEEDLSFTDNGSQCESDSESGSGEGPRSKRSRCEPDCDTCIQEKLDQLTIVEMPPEFEFLSCRRTVDMQCQTDPIKTPQSSETVTVNPTTTTPCNSPVKSKPQKKFKESEMAEPPVPTQRVQRRPTVKAGSKKSNKAQATVPAATARLLDEKTSEIRKAFQELVADGSAMPVAANSPLAEVMETEEFVGGMGGNIIIPPVLPMEFAMKYYHEPGMPTAEEKVKEVETVLPMDFTMEEWLRGTMRKIWSMIRTGNEKGLRSAAAIAVSGSDTQFGGTSGGEMIQPQQVIAAFTVIAVNCMNARKIGEKLKDFMTDIEKKTKTPDMQNALRTLCKLADMVVIEDEDEPVSPEDPEDRKLGGDDYMLSRHLLKLESLIKAASKYKKYVHVKDAERFLKSISIVDGKLQQADKEKQKLLNSIDDHKKDKERMERNHQKSLADLRVEKELKEKLNNQMKEKNKEMKKLEKKIKELTTQLEEKETMREKIESLQKECSSVQKKLHEEGQKHRKELQSKDETKRHMQQELNNRETDLTRTNQTIDDKSATIKKLEAQIQTEQKNNKTNIITQTERAKKAEISYLELQLELGVKRLKRAKEDAKRNLTILEEAASNRARPAVEQQMLAANRDEWRACAEEVDKIANQFVTKNEFGLQIEAIKSGTKTLSQLPVIEVPKPPPHPAVIPIPPVPVHVSPVAPPPPEPKPAPGVIGSRASSAQLPAPIGSNISPKSKAPGSPLPKPVATVASQPQSQSPVRHPGVIGTRAQTNGYDVTSTSSSSQVSSSNATQQQNAGWHHWNDINLFALGSDNLLPGAGARSFGTLTGDYPTSGTSASNVPTSLSAPGSHISQLAPGSQLAQSSSRDATSWSNDETWNKTNTYSNGYLPGGLSAAPGANPPQSSYNNWDDRRTSSASSQNKYAAIIERLAHTFPAVPHDKLVELANEYCTNFKTNLSDASVQDAFSVLHVYIMNKMKQHQPPPHLQTPQTDLTSHRRLLNGPAQPPPGAAPGYMGMGNILGADAARSTPNQHLMGSYNSFMDPPMNGGHSRNMNGPSDKWL